MRAGTSQVQNGGTIHSIAKVVDHDHYNSQLARFNDVALLKLAEPLEFDETTQPIELVDDKVSITEGYTGVISGWGTKVDGQKLPQLEGLFTFELSYIYLLIKLRFHNFCCLFFYR